MFQMFDLIGAKKAACVLLKSPFWFLPHGSGKVAEAEGFVKGGMINIEHVYYQLNLNEVLRSTLAPHGFCNGEDSVFLGRARRASIPRPGQRAILKILADLPVNRRVGRHGCRVLVRWAVSVFDHA